MPSVAELERLEALVSRLRQISGKQRGELIEAEAWNQLVSAVIDIGRATIEDTSSEVASHKHNDQVSLEWLDPKLRGIVLEGGLGDPGSAAQVGKLERQLTKLGRALDGLSDRLDRMQKDLSGLETRDVERETSVGSALRKIDGVFDAREDVAALRGSLRLIEGQVRTAAELSERLRDNNGEELDFNDLATRIGSLEEVSAQLELPDGNRFDGAAYARDLAQLRAELVTEEELRETIDNLEGGLAGNLRDELTESARTAALEANAGALEDLGTQLRNEQAAGLRGLEATLDDRVSSATGDLQEQILTVARREQQQTLEARLARFETARNAELDARLTAQAREITGQLDGFVESIRGDITAEVTAELQREIEGLEDRFALNEGNTAQLAADLEGLQASLSSTTRQLETMQRELLLADSRLNAALTERIRQLEVSVDERIKVTAEETRVAMRTERNNELAVLRTQMTTDMNRTLRDVARTEATIATSQLRGELTDIARAEASAELDTMRDEVLEAGTVSDAQLAGLVAAEVRRATADLDDRIKLSVESLQVRDTRNDRIIRRGDGRIVRP
jgi:hypothetical protein